MIAKIGDVKTVTIVELPSPANSYPMRYAAAAQLFTEAMYKENPLAVVFVIAGFVLLILLLIAKIYLRKKQPIDTLGKWLSDIAKFAVKRFKELFGKK